MKRGLLIAAGTLGGLGAVMAITPPQLTATSSLASPGAGAIGVPTATPATTTITKVVTSTASATATKSATTKAISKKKAKATSKATATKSATAANSNNSSNTAATATDPTATSAAAAPAVPAAAPAKGVTGSFVGPSVFVQYGNVQVQITVVDGHITDAKAVIAPSGNNSRYTNMAVPILRKQTLAAQSDAIQGASGASYTSYGWYKSLQGALAKAGL